MRGRNVLITGATSGIGRATALALGGMGAAIGVVARDAAKGSAPPLRFGPRAAWPRFSWRTSRRSHRSAKSLTKCSAASTGCTS